MEPGFRHYAVRSPLSDYLVGLWSYGHYAQPHRLERLLPTGTMTLAITIEPTGSVTATVAGARSSYFLLDTSKPFSVIAASFRAGGGFPFFGRPADELNNLAVPLEVLVGREASDLVDRLLEARSTSARFLTLEQFLLARLAEHTGRSAAVRYALRAFDGSSRVPRVASIVDEIGWSASRFIATFRGEVGLTPKVYSRVARFRRVVASLERMQDVDWADIALSCGYFDQPHFVHDFKEFAGVTPSEYLAERVSTNHVRVR
jgi:AraC-like DNA-binding protein